MLSLWTHEESDNALMRRRNICDNANMKRLMHHESLHTVDMQHTPSNESTYNVSLLLCYSLYRKGALAGVLAMFGTGPCDTLDVYQAWQTLQPMHPSCTDCNKATDDSMSAERDTCW